MNDREILELYVKGTKPAELMEKGISRNKAYKIYQRYRVFQQMLTQYEFLKDLILAVSNREFVRLKTQYKFSD